ncbi:MAG TPA: IS110 family transposase [Drouetiella sp.]
MSVHVGIDISKLTFDAVILPVSGKQRHRQFANDLGGFVQFTKWLAPHEVNELHVCMEGTGRLWEQLAEYLVARNFKISVVNPAQIKGFADSEMRRSKTDRLDAAIIARFCKSHGPRYWEAPSPDVKLLRDLQRHVDSLKEDQTRQTNRLSSGALDELITAGIRRNLAQIQGEIELYQAYIKELIAERQGLETARKVMSVIGVGQVLAATFVGELGSIDRFGRARDVEIFCGVTPRVLESGTSVRGRNRISKKGNSRLRRALFMAALSAMRHNPQLSEFAKRLKENGKAGKVIVCAVARKLLRTMFAIARSGQLYDPCFRSSIKPAG